MADKDLKLKVSDALLPMIKAAVEAVDGEKAEDSFKLIAKAVIDGKLTEEKAEGLRAVLRISKAAKFTSNELGAALIGAGLLKKADPPPKADSKPEPPAMKGYITKDDGKALDFEAMAVPEGMREFVKSSWEETQIAKAKAEAAEKVTAGLLLKSETAEIRARVEKTSHIGAHDDLTAKLLEIEPSKREGIFEMLEKADAAAALAGATSELGASGGGGDPSGDSMAKIEKMAEEKVSKSADGLTQAAAVAQVLQTKEGKKLHLEYLREKGAPLPAGV